MIAGRRTACADHVGLPLGTSPGFCSPASGSNGNSRAWRSGPPEWAISASATHYPILRKVLPQSDFAFVAWPRDSGLSTRSARPLKSEQLYLLILWHAV